MMEKKTRYYIVVLVIIVILIISPFFIGKGIVKLGILCLIIGVAGIWVGYFLKNKIVYNIAIGFLIIILGSWVMFVTGYAFSNM